MPAASGHCSVDARYSTTRREIRQICRSRSSVRRGAVGGGRPHAWRRTGRGFFQDFHAEPDTVAADSDSLGASDDAPTVRLIFRTVAAERTLHPPILPAASGACPTECPHRTTPSRNGRSVSAPDRFSLRVDQSGDASPPAREPSICRVAGIIPRVRQGSSAAMS
jgi:hypothetical protein